MELEGKKILITGASGSVGKQLIHELVGQGHRPVTHFRETSDTSLADRHKLEKRFADLGTDDELTALVNGIDAVVHTAAWVNFRRDQLSRFEAINCRGAVRLFEAAQKAGVRRFVHVSTVATVGAVRRRTGQNDAGRAASHKVDEDTQFNLDRLRIPYVITKRAAEEQLLAAQSSGRTELVIVNPAIIVAPSRRGDDRGQAIRLFSHLILPDLRNRINLVDIRDVAQGIVVALKKGRSGERYILGGDNIVIRELLLDMSSILGKIPHLVRAPRRLLRPLSRFVVAMRRLTGRHKITFYPDIVRMLDYDWAYSSRKARLELGYQPRSLILTLNDLLHNNFTDTYIKS